MKTKKIYLTIALVAIFFSSIAMASELVSSSASTYRSTITSKVEQLISNRITLTKEMNQTSAHIIVNVDENGNVSFDDVQYKNPEVANELKSIVKTMHYENTPLSAGMYNIKVKFIVK